MINDNIVCFSQGPGGDIKGENGESERLGRPNQGGGSHHIGSSNLAKIKLQLNTDDNGLLFF